MSVLIQFKISFVLIINENFLILGANMKFLESWMIDRETIILNF